MYHPFLADGIIQEQKVMESLLDLTVQKVLLDPLKFKQNIDLQDLQDGVDIEQMAGGNSGKVGGVQGQQVQHYGLPINMTFSEPSTKHNLEDQIDNRRFLAEYCFEKLNCQSISFVK